MKKWEYACEIMPVSHARKFVPILNRFGVEGWELVHCEFVHREFGNGECMLIFKRQLRSNNDQKEAC